MLDAKLLNRFSVVRLKLKVRFKLSKATSSPGKHDHCRGRRNYATRPASYLRHFYLEA